MKLSKGFTLIELIVVMAVFLFVIGAALGIFISIVQQQKKVLAEQQFLSQISYAEEYMSKALRMAVVDKSGDCLGEHGAGYIYFLTRYDPSSGLYRGIKFINQSGDSAGNPICQEFFLDDSTSQPVLKELKGANGLSDNNDSDAVELTPPSLQINSLKFSINGSNGSALTSSACNCSPTQCGACSEDTVQPRITILLNVSLPGESARTIQTTVSQRNLNTK